MRAPFRSAVDRRCRARAGKPPLSGGHPQFAANGRVPLAFAGVFLVSVAISVFAGRLPVSVSGLYLGASVMAFAAYVFDKSAAREKRWRTRETTLHLLGVIGGWPGALVAQRLLHHKTRKRSFQLVFWGTVMLNCAFLTWVVVTRRL